MRTLTQRSHSSPEDLHCDSMGGGEEKEGTAYLDKAGNGVLKGCSLPGPLPEFPSLLPVCHEVSNTTPPTPVHRLSVTMIFYLIMGPETQSNINTDSEVFL